MPDPLVSIITVTAKDPVGVAATLRSLSRDPFLASSLTERIVIDGGGDTAFRGIVPPTPDRPSYQLVREPDSGIYDAMNKGIAAATGAYVWFLNGGDTALSGAGTVIADSLRRHPHVDMLFFGFHLQGNGGIIKREPRNPADIWHALPTSHQAILYRRAAIPAGYDLSYGVASDYALTARIWKQSQSVAVERSAIAQFGLGGHSSQHVRQLIADANRVQREILNLGAATRALSQCRHYAAYTYRRRLNEPARQ